MFKSPWASARCIHHDMDSGIKCYFLLELDIVQLQFVQWRIAEGLIHMMGTLCIGLESELTWLVDLEDGVTSVQLESFNP
jgi:hypothetical protein